MHNNLITNISEPSSEKTNLIVTDKGVEGLIHLLGKKADVKPIKYRNGTIVPFPPKIATGQYTSVGALENIELGHLQGTFFHETRFRYLSNDQRSLNLYFPLVGSFIHQSDRRQTVLGDHGPEFLLARSSGSYEDLVFLPGKPISLLHLSVSQEFVKSVLANTESDAPLYQQLCSYGKLKENIFFRGSLSKEMNRLIGRLLSFRCEGIRGILESRADTLTLWGEVLDVFAVEYPHKQGKKSSFNFSLTDIEAITKARTILLSDITQTPTIDTLARSCGLNKQKLQTGFKQFFGTSINRYLRNYRLEFARQLIESGKTNLREVATSVGYANQSHFAIRFREAFGLLPRQYSRKCTSDHNSFEQLYYNTNK